MALFRISKKRLFHFHTYRITPISFINKKRLSRYLAARFRYYNIFFLNINY